MAIEVYANYPQTTVSSGGTTAPAGGTAETWTVASSSSFPASSSSLGTQFHVADPALPTEIILVTNVSGTTWTVTRGAESSTPVAHTTGFTVKQVVTAGLLKNFHVDTANVIAFGADPTGVNDSSAAFMAAYNSLPLTGSPAGAGGIVYAPTGTYRINTGLQFNAVAPVYLVGDGSQATRLNYYGTGGDCVSMYNNYVPAGGPASIAVWGGGVQDLTIDGTNATFSGTTSGLHIGDMKYGQVKRVNISNFNGTGGVGLWQDNRKFWTEDCLFEVHVLVCKTAVLIDSTGVGAGTAHDNNHYDIGMSLADGVSNGVVLQNNVNCYHCWFDIHGGGSSSSSGSPGYWLTLSNTGGNTFMNLCKLDMRMESDGGLAVSQGMILTQGGSGISAHGMISYQNGAGVTNSSIAAQFKFTGPIFGDTSLNGMSITTVFNASTAMNKPPQLMIVSGGTVSAIKLNGTNVGVTSGSWPVFPGMTYEIDCTVNPTVTWIPLTPK